MERATEVAVFALSAILLLAAAAHGQVPQKMNYQLMVTNDLDEPLTEQEVSLFFTIYDEPEEGTLLWSELHSDTTNSIGVASVVLGETSPLTSELFEAPRWLEVAIDGHTLHPRRELVASPYALQAGDSRMLAALAPEEYVLDDDLSYVGTVNDPENPVDWTMLKNVPAGFADGTDHTGGVGDGHSLDAVDGNPLDALYVDPDGDVGKALRCLRTSSWSVPTARV